MNLNMTKLLFLSYAPNELSGEVSVHGNQYVPKQTPVGGSKWPYVFTILMSAFLPCDGSCYLEVARRVGCLVWH